MAESQWCEECKETKQSAYRRPDAGGRVLCNDCHLAALRRNSPTNLVKVPAYLRGKAK